MPGVSLPPTAAATGVQSRIPRVAYTVALLAMALASGLAVLFSTAEHGCGLTTDSIHYLECARRFGTGDGLTSGVPDGVNRPFAHWPPLLPILLAILGGGVGAARALNMVCLVTALLVLGLGLWRVTGRPRPAVIAVALWVVSGGVLEAHRMVYSEAPFLLLQSCAMVLLVSHLKYQRWGSLIAAGLCFGAAALVRYAGAGIAFGAVVAVILLGGSSFRSRCGRAMFVSVLAAAPMVLWLVSLKFMGAGTGNRELMFKALDAGWFLDVWRTFTLWLLPEQLSRWVRHGLAALLVAAFLWACYRNLRRPPEAGRDVGVFAAGLLIALSHILFVFMTAFFTSDEPTLELRMFLPAQLAFLTAAVFGLDGALAGAARPARHAAALAAVAFFAAGIIRQAGEATAFAGEGRGFGSRNWRQSQLMAEIRRLPQGVAVHTNQPEAVYWLARPCLRLPVAERGNTKAARRRYRDTTYAAEMNALKETISNGGYVAVFVESWPWFDDASAISERLGLSPLLVLDDGVLLATVSAP